jgi:hypothetical protein
MSKGELWSVLSAWTAMGGMGLLVVSFLMCIAGAPGK